MKKNITILAAVLAVAFITTADAHHSRAQFRLDELTPMKAGGTFPKSWDSTFPKQLPGDLEAAQEHLRH